MLPGARQMEQAGGVLVNHARPPAQLYITRPAIPLRSERLLVHGVIVGANLVSEQVLSRTELQGEILLEARPIRHQLCRAVSYWANLRRW